MSRYTEMNRDDSWHMYAACRDENPELWFHEHPGDWLSPLEQEAIRICKTCDVRARCLEEALANDWPFIWGGTTPSQRRRMRYERKKAV